MNPTCWSGVQGGRSVRNKIILPQSRRKAGELRRRHSEGGSSGGLVEIVQEGWDSQVPSSSARLFSTWNGALLALVLNVCSLPTPSEQTFLSDQSTQRDS